VEFSTTLYMYILNRTCLLKINSIAMKAPSLSDSPEIRFLSFFHSFFRIYLSLGTSYYNILKAGEILYYPVSLQVLTFNYSITNIPNSVNLLTYYISGSNVTENLDDIFVHWRSLKKKHSE
jgi:hypothetical protein